MNRKPALCIQRSLATICIWGCLTQLSAAAPWPQNFFDQAAVGALDVARQVAEIFQNGAAVRKDVGFQLPGIGAYSKSEIGVGNAMIQRGDSSKDDEDEYRRKRSADSDDLAGEASASTGPRTSFTQIMRRLNAPCHSGGAGTGGGTETGGDGEDIVDEARRRMKARMAAAGKKLKKNINSKSKNGRRRRRRQTEADDLEGLGEDKQTDLENEFKTHVQQFVEKINRVYENIAATVMEMMKRMEEETGGDGGKP